MCYQIRRVIWDECIFERIFTTLIWDSRIMEFHSHSTEWMYIKLIVEKRNFDVTCDCFFCSAHSLFVRSFHQSLVQWVNRLIIQAKRISQIHPSSSALEFNCNILLFSIYSNNISQQFIDSLTFGIAFICTFRAKLDYLSSKLQPQQHIDRDKNSSPISAGWYLDLFLFLLSDWELQSHFSVWNQITKKQTWNVSCDIFNRKIPLSSMRIVFERNEKKLCFPFIQNCI